MSLKITSFQSGFGEYLNYRTILKDASGIFPKTPIKVAGITAGKIKKIELHGNNALVTFRILKRIKVTKGSSLIIKSVGFLGDKYIEIKVVPNNKRLEEGGFIIAIDKAGIENILKDTSTILKDVKELVGALREGLISREGDSELKLMIKNFRDLTINAKDVAKNMKEVLVNNKGKFGQSMSNLKNISEQLVKVVSFENNVSPLTNFNRTLDGLQKISLDVKDIVSEIKKGKGTFGSLLMDDKLAGEVKDTISSVKKFVKKVDAVRTELALFSGVDVNDGGQTSVKLSIFPSPEKLYEVGLSTTKMGIEKEKKTTTITGGVSTEQVTKTVDKNSFKFDAQLGRKIQNWIFRGGVIESTGGLGVDYNYNDWGSKFSVDLFDYREVKGANLRFSSETQMWNIFYGKTSLNDIFNKERSASISAGLKFNDDDLKGLFGFFF
jgi:phospholipid/cholesterol/gamma-HCH transport system substrate-binding protein